jgi:hypothetical protein
MCHTSVAALLLSGAFLAAPKLSIVIYNVEAVPPAELERAQAIAGRILRQAGIETAWRLAGSRDLSPAPYEIPVHLLSVHPPSLTPETSGYAILMGDSSYAGISYPAVRASAVAMESDQSVLLGAVIAHELGHVLLGGRDHSTSGVMVARLGRREMEAAARGELQFLRSQAHRIRTEAARRSAASKNVIEELHDPHAYDARFPDRRHPSRAE